MNYNLEDVKEMFENRCYFIDITTCGHIYDDVTHCIIAGNLEDLCRTIESIAIDRIVSQHIKTSDCKYDSSSTGHYWRSGRVELDYESFKVTLSTNAPETFESSFVNLNIQFTQRPFVRLVNLEDRPDSLLCSFSIHVGEGKATLTRSISILDIILQDSL
jgi:hypothetical protein